MKTVSLRAALTALALCLAAGLLAAQPPGKGGGKPGGGEKPSPDIVYLSDDGSTLALYQAAIRGTKLAAGGVSGSDLSLQKSKAGRNPFNIAWSPDGTRIAWIETGRGMVSTPQSIMIGAPGSKGTAIFTSVPGDGKPQLNWGYDTLAWGPDCNDSAATILVFPTYDPVGIFAIRFVNDQPSEPEPLLVVEAGGGFAGTNAFSFSPTGQYLAFEGSGPDGSYGLWLLPVCPDIGSPRKLGPDQFAWPPIVYTDWSRWGDRLALSVLENSDSSAWRDIAIVYLNYRSPDENDPNEVIEFADYVRLDLTPWFTDASSELSPQWGPSTAGTSCQRIAFSQSSDIAPKGLYLLDIGAADGSGGLCDFTTPLGIDAKSPRALDWK